MIITITVDDNKVLKAVVEAMIKSGYPKDDVLDNPKQVDEGDIINLISYLDITAHDVEIERD